MKRVSAKVRRDAVLLCSIAASDERDDGYYDLLALALGLSDHVDRPAPAAILAYKTWAHLYTRTTHLSDPDPRALEAECAQYLLDGETPPS